MIENAETGALESFNFEHLQKHVPELQNFTFRIDTYQFDPPMDSSDMDPDAWRKLVRIISDNYNQYTGFVILHGTDTMAYTAAALSYLIQGSPKPVILTGAQKPIGFDSTDSKINLTDAFRCAASDLPGVSIVFNSHVILGTRARKTRTKSFNAFSSIDYPETAVFRDMRLIPFLRRPDPMPPVQFYEQLDPAVFVLRLVPGMRADIIPLLAPHYRALVVESFGVGGLPGGPKIYFHGSS